MTQCNTSDTSDSIYDMMILYGIKFKMQTYCFKKDCLRWIMFQISAAHRRRHITYLTTIRYIRFNLWYDDLILYGIKFKMQTYCFKKDCLSWTMFQISAAHRRRHITYLTYLWYLWLQAASERALSNAFFQPWLRQANLIPKCCRTRNLVAFPHPPHSARAFQLTNWARNAALPRFAIRSFWPEE